MSTPPVPLHWTDDTYAVVSALHVPPGVKRGWCFSFLKDAIGSAPDVTFEAVPPGWRDSYVKVKIADLAAHERSKLAWISEDRQHAVMKCKDIPPGVLRAMNWAGLYAPFRVNDPRHDREYYAKVKLADVTQASPGNAFDKLAAAKPVPAPVPPVPMFDGITAAECLRRYTENMRAYDSLKPGQSVATYALTTSQKDAAHAEWKAQLAAKQAATREKERHQVTVDREFEDWE